MHGYKPAFRIGGPIESVSALANGLAARGHEVLVCTTNSNLDEDLDIATDVRHEVGRVGVWYFRRGVGSEAMRRRFPALRTGTFLFCPRMRRFLADAIPTVDIVHTHMPFIYPTAVAARIAIQHRRPLFYHQRGVFDPARLSYRPLKKHLYVRFVEQPVLRRATCLVALNEAERASFHQLAPGVWCEVIPNGIDLAQFESGVTAKSPWESRIASDAEVMLFMGRLHATKGVHRLLDAFGRVHARHPKALLVLAGPDEQGMRARLEDAARGLGISNRVLFPGMVTGAEKMALLRRANLFALLSDAEGMSMAVLEALGSGCPVLLSTGCHMPEVEQAGAGRVVSGDPDIVANALDKLLEDPARLKEMGARAKDLVRQRYAWPQVVERIEDAYYTAVLGGGRDSAT